MSTFFDARQSVLRSALVFVGSVSNDGLDTIFPKINNELAKAFEDKNAQISQGGTLTFSGTAISFTEALQLTLAGVVAGADPVTFDLGSTTRSVSQSGKMIYAVLNRTATKDTVFTVTIASPAVFTTGSNHDLFVGQAIYFTTSGALPTGLTPNIVYYVSAVPSAMTYRVSASLGGSDINTSGSQSGVHTQHTIGTVTVTDDASVLPAVDSSNQEVFMIARRFDAQDGTMRLYFRNGFIMNSGDSVRLGAATGGSFTFLDGSFRIKNTSDPTKQLAFDVSGIPTATTLTLKIQDSSGTISTINSIYTAVIGSSAQVSAGQANYSSFATAIAALSNGDCIRVLANTYTENVVCNKQISFEGNGRGTVINGTWEWATGANYSSLSGMKFTDNMTFDVGIDGVQVNKIWFSSGKTFVDNTTTTNNIYLGFQE